MATQIGTLIATFEADISKFEAGRKQAESGMKHTASSVNQSQKQMSDGELRLAQQAKLAQYQHRQSLNALVTQYKQAERAAQHAAAGTKPFSQALSELSTSVATLQGPLGGISGRLSSLSSLFAGLTGPIGLVAVGLGALAAGAIAAGTAIYGLAKATAESTGHFKDLAQQTGFSVETLSALSNVAETSGGSIDTVTASLGIFQRNMTEAQDPTTEMSRLFKQLSIDTKDNEKALRQALAELRKLPDGATQTALAMRLFGRSGREVLAISKELPGTLDEAIKSMRGVNLVTTEMANKGDDVSDAITKMGQVFGHAANILGQEFGPQVKTAVEDATRAIIANKQNIELWGGAFAEATGKILSTATALLTLISNLRTLDNIPVLPVLNILFGSGRGAAGANIPDLISPLLNTPAYRRPNFSAFRPEGLGAPKTPRGAKTGRAEPDTVGGWKAALDGLRRINDQMLDEVRKFDAEMTRLSSSVQDAMTDQAFAILALQSNTPDWLHQAEEFIRAKTAEGYAWDENTKQVYLNNAARLEQFRILQQGATRGRSVTMLKGGGDDGFAGAGGKFDRQGTLMEQYQIHIERMQDLAYSLTNTIDRAIYDGFEGGLKRGFQSLTLGVLDMVKNVFLTQLQNSIANALSGVGGGGGGIFSKIFGAVFGAAAGGFGGGAFTKGSMGGGYAGKFQHGGTIPMGQWGIVHQNEKVMATPFGSLVVPSGQREGGTTINHIHVHAPGGSSYSSKKSQRQLAMDITAGLQGFLA